ncbi:MAG: hypothetical protein WC850_05510 [Candidatus Gracilibacteria bacterium]
MLNAKEASEMIEKMSPEDRLKALQNEVSEKTRNALESEILKSVAAFKKKVDITLNASICTDADEKIRDLLNGLGYQDIKVTSDFPGYNEDYTGTTTIKFQIP